MFPQFFVHPAEDFEATFTKTIASISFTDMDVVVKAKTAYHFVAVFRHTVKGSTTATTKAWCQTAAFFEPRFVF